MATLVLIWVRKMANVCKVKAGYELCGEKCCRGTDLPTDLPFLWMFLAFWPSHSCSTHSCGGLEADSRSSSRGSLEELSQSRSAGAAKQKVMLDYGVYMAKYVQPQAPPRSPTANESPRHSPESSPQTTKKVGNDRGALLVVNLFSY